MEGPYRNLLQEKPGHSVHLPIHLNVGAEDRLVQHRRVEDNLSILLLWGIEVFMDSIQEVIVVSVPLQWATKGPSAPLRKAEVDFSIIILEATEVSRVGLKVIVVDF